jgi:glycosyltransferase involved in cell wall biosynthesis
VIYNFINTGDEEAREARPEPADHFRIGVVANIRRLKGHYDLIEVARTLRNRHFAHRFYLAGNDLTAGDLRERVRREGLDDCFAELGFVSDISRFLAGVDAFLLPSYVEGLPTSILEAMHHGVPVVATNVGGVPEMVVDGESGRVVRPGDIEALANAITELSDPVTASRYARRGKQLFEEKFSKESNYARWLTLLRALEAGGSVKSAALL